MTLLWLSTPFILFLLHETGAHHQQLLHNEFFLAFSTGKNCFNRWKTYSPWGIGVSTDENCIPRGENVLKGIFADFPTEKRKFMTRLNKSPSGIAFLCHEQTFLRRGNDLNVLTNRFPVGNAIFICFRYNPRRGNVFKIQKQTYSYV